MSNRALLTALLIALLMLLLSERSLAPLRQLVGGVIYPISRPLTELTQSLRSIAQAVHEIGELRTEAARLADENRSLQARVAELEAVRYENDTLRAALAFRDEHRDQTLQSARVIGRASQSFLRSLEVDQGEGDGVAAGAPVIADGFLVGVVSRVTPRRSTVQLITSSDARVAVVFTRSRGQGILQGGLDGLVATHVPLDVTVERDEPVVTSGLGGRIPANIPVGRAGERRSLSSNILQELRVISPVNFSKLELVFIGAPADRQVDE